MRHHFDNKDRTEAKAGVESQRMVSDGNAGICAYQGWLQLFIIQSVPKLLLTQDLIVSRETKRSSIVYS